MVQDDNITEIGQGYHALYHNIQVRRAYGYGVVSGGSVSPGSDGGVSVDVTSGTAIHGASTTDIPSKTSLTLATPDGSNPRKDLIVLTSAGNVTDVTGQPASALPSGEDRFRTHQPSPPDGTGGDYVVLAEVWVGAGTNTIQTADINDLRTDPAAVAHGLTVTDDVTDEDGTVLLDESEGLVGDGRVDTAAIQNDAVTSAKIPGGAVGGSQVAQDAIGTFQLDLSISPTWTGEHTFEGFNTIQSASDYLAGDGSSNDAGPFETMIEDVDDAGGGLILLEQPDSYYNFDSVPAPNTSGNRVVILGVGRPRIDVSGLSNPRIDFEVNGAKNITLKHVKVTAEANGTDGIRWAIRTGPGFHFYDIFIEGGAGGMDVRSADVYGELLRVENVHDTRDGWGSALHSGEGAKNAHISGVIIRDADRAVETDDGPEELLYENGWIENIDNSGATNDHTSFTLDVHRHDGAEDCRDITYRNWFIKDASAAAFSASNHSTNGLVENIKFEDITILDGTPAPYVEADSVTVDGVDYYHPSTGKPDEYIKFHGGQATVRDFTGHFAPTNHFIKFRERGREPYDYFEIEGFRGDAASQTTTRALKFVGGDGVPYTRIEAFQHDGTFDVEVADIEDGALAGSPSDDDYALEIVDSHFDAGDQNLDIHGSNGPIRLQGGVYAAASSNLRGNHVEAYGVKSPDPALAPVPMRSVATDGDLPADAPDPSVVYVEDEDRWYTYTS